LEFTCYGYHYRFGSTAVVVHSGDTIYATFSGTAPSSIVSSSSTRSHLSAILSGYLYVQCMIECFSWPCPAYLFMHIADDNIATRLNRFLQDQILPYNANHYDLYQAIMETVETYELMDTIFDDQAPR
jgi:hypothetical protein